MIHLTFNTGHSVHHKPGDISLEAIAACRPLVEAGGGPIPGVAPWRVQITPGNGCAVWSISRGTQPHAVLCGLAWTAAGAAEVWTALERVHHQQSEALARAGALAESVAQSPEMPQELPWLGVVILPGLGLSAQSDVSWLGDFERCLAQTILTIISE